MVLVLIVRLPLVPLLSDGAYVDSGLVSRIVATFGARPKSQLRYTLAMRLTKRTIRSGGPLGKITARRLLPRQMQFNIKLYAYKKK